MQEVDKVHSFLLGLNEDFIANSCWTCIFELANTNLSQNGNINGKQDEGESMCDEAPIHRRSNLAGDTTQSKEDSGSPRHDATPNIQKNTMVERWDQCTQSLHFKNSWQVQTILSIIKNSGKGEVCLNIWIRDGLWIIQVTPSLAPTAGLS